MSVNAATTAWRPLAPGCSCSARVDTVVQRTSPAAVRRPMSTPTQGSPVRAVIATGRSLARESGGPPRRADPRSARRSRAPRAARRGSRPRPGCRRRSGRPRRRRPRRPAASRGSRAAARPLRRPPAARARNGRLSASARGPSRTRPPARRARPRSRSSTIATAEGSCATSSQKPRIAPIRSMNASSSCGLTTNALAPRA